MLQVPTPTPRSPTRNPPIIQLSTAFKERTHRARPSGGSTPGNLGRHRSWGTVIRPLCESCPDSADAPRVQTGARARARTLKQITRENTHTNTHIQTCTSTSMSAFERVHACTRIHTHTDAHTYTRARDRAHAHESSKQEMSDA